jgi:hypothetical protein
VTTVARYRCGRLHEAATACEPPRTPSEWKRVGLSVGSVGRRCWVALRRRAARPACRVQHLLASRQVCIHVVLHQRAPTYRQSPPALLSDVTSSSSKITLSITCIHMELWFIFSVLMKLERFYYNFFVANKHRQRKYSLFTVGAKC